MKKIYVTLYNGCVGYIKGICTCNHCKERGEAEIFIDGLNGDYLDCIRHHELFNKHRVLNIGNDINELSIEHTDVEIAKLFADVYQNELLKCKGKE